MLEAPKHETPRVFFTAGSTEDYRLERNYHPKGLRLRNYHLKGLRLRLLTFPQHHQYGEKFGLRVERHKLISDLSLMANEGVLSLFLNLTHIRMT